MRALARRTQKDERSTAAPWNQCSDRLLGRWQEDPPMRRPKIQPTRNKLDLTDQTQVRVVTKRLRLSPAELTEMVGRIGNSITAITKEVTQQRAARSTPPGSVIASVTVTETKAEVIVPDETAVT
jgi:Protein of unknown function (DUF3606)